ncbi:MAG TPA: hypothetical protein VNX70_11215 [Bryobacteraceae bacterium]|nr:hypothetical protein [Bryobacteraceae bacterium]
MTESTDPYLYPGTDVLKNLRGIRDPNTLSQFEAESTTRRIVQLIQSPVQCRFNTPCVRAIHKHIGLHAGLIIDWSRITPDKMMAASRESFRSGDNSGLAALIQTSII